MANDYILRAAIEDGRRSDGAHSLRKVFPTSANKLGVLSKAIITWDWRTISSRYIDP